MYGGGGVCVCGFITYVARLRISAPFPMVISWVFPPNLQFKNPNMNAKNIHGYIIITVKLIYLPNLDVLFQSICTCVQLLLLLLFLNSNLA